MGPAPEEKSQQPAGVDTGRVISNPTSPEQIHQEAAAGITSSLNVVGLPVTVENVKSDQTYQVPPDFKETGMEPSGGEISPSDAVRIITEELGGQTEGTHRVGVGKGLDPFRLRLSRQNKRTKFFNRLGLEKAA